DGYGGLLPKETSPSFALCVTVDPDTIDVNVHPSKREVKCSDSRSVYRSVADTVRSAVREGGDIPEWTTVEASPIMINNGGRADDETLTQPIRYGPTISGHSVASDVPAGLREPLSLDDSQIALPLSMQEQDESVRSETEPDGVPRQPQQRFFQLHGSYILAQVKQGLIAVDQHLAHQRVLYDQAVEHVAGEGSTAGQALLFPGTFEFGFNEIVIVREVMPFLERMGFGIRDFGGNTIVVDAIPVGLESWNEGDLLRDIVGDLISERTAHLDLGDRALDPTAHYLAASYARRVAIPHGKAMQQGEMENLIDQLFACSEPYTTPTGRPTLTRLTLEDISRRFAP
ncbi:MAG: hypothetical protein CME19_23885, partial [Gemmatimonadetes bacterium]|nr:hypothetical protein [Gemmatimonadota bacterium]